jgi:hypothetical protein
MSRGSGFVFLIEFRRLMYVHILRSGLCLEAIIGVVIVWERTLIKPKFSSPRSQNSVIGYYVELSQSSSELHNVFYLTVTSILIISPILSLCQIIHSFIQFIRSFIK